jgi:hypothetical protein
MRRAATLPLLLLLPILATVAGAAGPPATPGGIRMVGTSVAPRSISFASLPPRPPGEVGVEIAPEHRPEAMSPEDERELERLKENPRGATPEALGRFTRDLNASPLALSMQPGQGPLAPAAGNGFEGITQGGYIPSEPTVAAGPLNIFSAGNVSVTVTDKDGSNRVEIDGATFFGAPVAEGPVSDAQCYYDALRGRFVALCFTFEAGSYFYLAISKTSDARGEWWLYKFDMAMDGNTPTPNFSDYEALGVSGDKIAMTAQQYGYDPWYGAYYYQYSKIRVLDRAAAYDGQALPYVDFVNFAPPPGGDLHDVFVTKAARNLSAGDDTIHLFCVRTSGGTNVTYRTITGPPNAPVLSAGARVPVGLYAPPPDATQQGATNLVATNDCRPTDFYVRDGVLICAWHTALDLGGQVSALRLFRMRTSDHAVLTDESYGASGVFYYYPAVTVDSVGSIFLGFDRSSAQEYPSAWATGKRRGDAALQSSTLLKSGRSSTSHSRWGDYTGIDNDASLSGPGGSVAWYAGQYTRSPNTFGTWVNRLLFSYGQVAGSVSDDADGEASTTGDRAPLAGMTLRLVQGGNTLATTSTDSAGNYSFGYLESGTYDVVVGTQGDTVAVDAIAGAGATSQVRASATDVQVALADSQSSSGNVFVVASRHPAPVLSGISPASRTLGDPAFTLALNGSGFGTWSVVRLDGDDRTTTFLDKRHLTATIPASDMLAGGTHAITVFNPVPGGGLSNAVPFVVSETPDTLAPVVTLSSPVGGESWAVGSSQVITWTASDDLVVESVDLAWSDGGGATFPHAIAAGLPNTGSLAWTVPMVPTQAARVRVTAHDGAGHAGADSSHADFTLLGWTIAASAGANGAVAPSGDVVVTDGATPSFTITPARYHHVADVLVNGASVGADSFYTFAPVHADQSLVASFAIDTLKLTLATTGNGALTADPDQSEYLGGQVVTLTATPDSSWSFSGWSGDAAGVENPLAIEMDRDKSITAVFNQHTYLWSASGTSAFGAPSNWTPARTSPAPDDVLVFATGSTVTAIGVTSQTIGQLLVANSTNATLNAGSAATLSIRGRGGPDFAVQAGSTLQLGGTSAITIALAAPATGLVSGNVIAAGTAHRMLALGAGALVFAPGGLLVLNPGFSGNVFGLGSGASALNSVVFQAGSILAQAAGASPFGASAPGSVVTFEAGSRFRVDGPISPDISGRHYGDFEHAYYSSTTITDGAAFTMDSVIVTSGTLSLNTGGGGTIRGDVVVRSNAGLALLAGLGAPVYTLAGTAGQRIDIAGGFTQAQTAKIRVNNPAGVTMLGNWTLSGPLEFAAGRIVTGANTLRIASPGSITGASAATGWVAGNLIRNFTAGASSRTFDVGDLDTYAPVSVAMAGASSALDIAARTDTPDHPNLGTSDLEPAKSVNRWWTLSPIGTIPFTSYDAVFDFAPSDLDAGTDPANLFVRRYASGAWSAPATGMRAATRTQAMRMASFGTFAIGESNDQSPPVVALTSPAGGETWPAGSSHAITWGATDDGLIESVDLAWSSDGGATFPNVIATAIPNTGTFAWSVPAARTSSARVRVTARDGVGRAAADSSHADFTILGWTITATAGPDGSISPGGAVIVGDGATPTYTMVPDRYHHVTDVRVNGASVGARTSYTFAPVHADQSLDATFAIDTLTLTLGKTGNGTVTADPAQPSYLGGQVVTVTATPDPGWYFVNWSGDTSGTTNQIPIRMDRNKRITANFGQHQYVWIATGNAAFGAANNWSPPRTIPATDDVLIFSGGNVVAATGVSGQKIGQLLVMNHTYVTLLAGATAALVVAGGEGPDLDVQAGSTLELLGLNPISVVLPVGASGRVSGTLNVGGGAHHLYASGDSSLVFASGGALRLGSGFSGSVFGDGTGVSALHSVVFQRGSLLIQASGASPFGAPAPNSVVVFEAGSRYRVDGTITPDLSGREYGDFEYNTSGFTNISASLPFRMDTLVVTQGSLSLLTFGGGTIRGDVRVRQGATLSVVPPAAPSRFVFGGAAEQSVNIAGSYIQSPNATFVLDNPEGVRLLTSWALAGPLQFAAGRIMTGPNALTLGPTAFVNGASPSTGWIAGNLRRSMPAGSSIQFFEVGDSLQYAPVTLTLDGVTSAFDVVCRTDAADHPELGSSDLDATKSANRWWSISPVSPQAFASYDAFFRFAASDVDAGANPMNFQVRRYASGHWHAAVAGARSATSLKATGLTAFGDFAMGESGDQLPPVVTLLSPSGRERWNVGSSHAITWAANDDGFVDSVDLAWSSDGGATFPNLIATGLVNTGTYSWTVPPALTQAARVRVTARDAAGHADTDSSHADFAITGWTITANAGPNGSVAPSGTVVVGDGATLNVAITAAAGYHVADVLVNGVSVGAVGSYWFAPVHADQRLDASFAPGRFTIAITTIGMGSVSSYPEGPAYTPNQEVVLTATPDPGRFFLNWDGDVQGTANPVRIVMDTSKSVTAVFGSHVYTWTASGPGAFGVATNWIPSRVTPAPDDVLDFSGGGTATVTGVTTQTIGQLTVSNHTTVSLATTAGATLTISGLMGTDIDVQAGSTLRLAGPNALTLALAHGASGRVSGAVDVAGGAHQLNALDESGLVFGPGSALTIGANFTGYVFGTGTGTSALNSVVFQAGSLLAQAVGATPFGANAPNAVVVFEAGSRYRLDGPYVPSFAGRQYADFEHNTPATTDVSGSAPFGVDNLIVSKGTLRLNLAGGGTIRGDIQVLADASLGFDSPAPSAVYRLGGAAGQAIDIAGTFTQSENASIEVSDPAGVALRSNWTIPGTLAFTAGRIVTGADTLLVALAGSITGASATTGWVDGNLSRTFLIARPSERRFDVGDHAAYLPATFKSTQGGGPDQATCRARSGDHPNQGLSGLDATRGVNGWWRFAYGHVGYGETDIEFEFMPEQLDPGANPWNFFVRRFAAGAWTAPMTNARTPTSTRVIYATPFGELASDFVIGEIASFAITASAGLHGSITPGGPVGLQYGGGQSFAITPDPGYVVEDVLVDGISMGPRPFYDFTNVTANRTIAATFADHAAPVVTVTGPGGGETLPRGTLASLTWTAADSAGVASVDLLLGRAGAGGPFDTLAAAQPNSGAFDWTVTGPLTADAWFKVVARDSAGNAGSDVSDAAFTIGDTPVEAFALSGVRPNPMSTGGQFPFALPSASRVRLSVLDVQGREVLVLADGEFPAGRHVLAWSNGQRANLGSGLYFVRLRAGGRTFTRRFVLAR